MNANNYLELMLALVREAGKIAVDLIENSEPGFKTDNSIVTKADHAISQLTHRHLENVLNSPGHILIDEEDPQNIRYLDQERLEQAEYVWSLDPIDGTRLYANAMPHYGISIGLLKNLKPYMGVVYFPHIGELFYCDGEKAYFVRHAFSDREEKKQIQPIDQEITTQHVFFCHDSFFQKYQWDYSTCRVMILACAVIDICWPAIGRGCGSILQPAIWDIAGSWPIARCAGLDLRVLKTGEVWDRLDVGRVSHDGKKPWEATEAYILSSERNFHILRESMILLQNQ